MPNYKTDTIKIKGYKSKIKSTNICNSKVRCRLRLENNISNKKLFSLKPKVINNTCLAIGMFHFITINNFIKVHPLCYKKQIFELFLNTRPKKGKI